MIEESVLPGAGRASLVAGPSFVTLAVAASLYSQVPNPIAIQPHEVGVFAIALIPSTIIGALIAFIPALMANWLLTALASKLPLFRSPMLWIAIGAAAGYGMATLADFGALDELVFASSGTGAICAAICRSRLAYSGLWLTASTLIPSGSRTKAP